MAALDCCCSEETSLDLSISAFPVPTCLAVAPATCGGVGLIALPVAAPGGLRKTAENWISPNYTCPCVLRLWCPAAHRGGDIGSRYTPWLLAIGWRIVAFCLIGQMIDGQFHGTGNRLIMSVFRGAFLGINDIIECICDIAWALRPSRDSRDAIGKLCSILSQKRINSSIESNFLSRCANQLLIMVLPDIRRSAHDDLLRIRRRIAILIDDAVLDRIGHQTREALILFRILCIDSGFCLRTLLRGLSGLKRLFLLLYSKPGAPPAT